MDEQAKIEATRRAIEQPQVDEVQACAHWIDGYEERMRKHIQFALKYADDFNHGAPGHLDLLTIATLARQLSFALDQEPPRV